jgi:hypothetical protein
MPLVVVEVVVLVVYVISNNQSIYNYIYEKNVFLGSITLKLFCG